jgi:hypothetical protein
VRVSTQTPERGIVHESVVAGETIGTHRVREATMHVFPSIVRDGRALLVIKNRIASTDVQADALIALDEDGRRQVIESLGGTA